MVTVLLKSHDLMSRETIDFINALREFRQRLQAGQVRMLLPRSEGLWENRPGFFYHLEAELFLQTDGGCEFRFPRQKFDLLPGDILLVPPGMPHHERILPHRGERFRNFVVTCRAHMATFHQAGSPPGGVPQPFVERRLKLPDPDFYFHLIQTIAEWRGCRREELRTITDALAETLLQKLLSDLEITPLEAEPEELPFQVSHKTLLAKNYLDENFPSRFPDVMETARAVGCSPNYLSTLFHREMGVTIKEYVNDLKFQYARHMLETSNFNISEIAGSCGFGDVSYFARKFRERFGKNPSQLR